MFQKIFTGIAIIFSFFVMTKNSLACDPLGCMLNGHNQDALILGEVTEHDDTETTVKILFKFPQTQNMSMSLATGNIITVRELAKTLELQTGEPQTVEAGGKYLLSLNREENLFVPAWGIYEVTGTGYADARLVHKNTLDDDALEIFINSGGKTKDFAFDYSGDTATLTVKDGQSSQRTLLKLENVIWFAFGFLSSAILFMIVKKKHKV